VFHFAACRGIWRRIATGGRKVARAGLSIGSSVARRQEKTIKIQNPKTGKAQVIRFDRRTGVIVLKKVLPPPRPMLVSGLVRRLLTFLSPTALAYRSLKRTSAAKSR
jgi:hypothetical protein